MTKSAADIGTKLKFIGGVNRDRIGGNCSIIEHTDEEGGVTRVMFDLGTMFTPYESDFSAALPDVQEYFARRDENGNVTPPLKPVQALFLTHAHEDHIGAIAYLWRDLLCPIYATPFAVELIEDARRDLITNVNYNYALKNLMLKIGG